MPERTNFLGLQGSEGPTKLGPQKKRQPQEPSNIPERTNFLGLAGSEGPSKLGPQKKHQPILGPASAPLPTGRTNFLGLATTAPLGSADKALLDLYNKLPDEIKVNLKASPEAIAKVVHAYEQYTPAPIKTGAQWLMKQLDRPGAAVRAFLAEDAKSEEPYEDLAKAVVAGVKAFKEPNNKNRGNELVKKVAPEFSKNNPKTTAILGFLTDIATDPLTFISGKGTINVVRAAGGEALTRAGVSELARETARLRHGYAIETAAKGAKKIGVVTQEAGEAAQKALDAGLSSLVSDSSLLNIRKATADEIRQAAGDHVSSLIRSSEEAAKKLEKPKGAALAIGIPFTKLESEIPLPIVDIVSEQVSKLKNLRPVDAALATLSKTYGRPPEFNKMVTQLEEARDYAQQQAYKIATDLKTKFSQESLDKIGKTGWNIDSATQNLETQLGRPLTTLEANQAIDDVVKQAKLTPDEQAQLARSMQNYSDWYKIEKQAGLVEQSITNYNPRIYKLIEKPKIYNFIKKNNAPGVGTVVTRGLNKKDAFTKHRQFATEAEAVAAGFQPEYDAAVLYAHRFLQHEQEMARAQFREAFDDLFKSKNFKGDLVPARIAKDVDFIGNAQYPGGMGEDLGYFVKYANKMNNAFRLSATRKPGFGLKQMIGNPLLMGLVQGTKAMKAFDPRAALDTALLILAPKRTTRKLPAFIENFFLKKGEQGLDSVLASRVAMSKVSGAERLENYLDDFKLVSALGQTYTGREIYDGFLKRGIIRGIDGADQKINSAIETAVPAQARGYVGVIKEFMKFWNHASMAEDYARTITGVNALRLGHSFDEAKKIVNKTLFDYIHGLSPEESKYLRSIVTFYTFPRFAVPAILTAAVQKPSALLNYDRFMDLANKLLVTGEDLNPAERFVAQEQYIFEQPNVFRGFDKEGKANFNVFSSINPIDALNILKFDGKGKLDVRQSVEEGIFGTFVPYIKLPIEHLADKDFFREKTIEEAARTGRVSATSLAAALPQDVRDLMGFETVINDKGQVRHYVNPYLTYYGVQLFPGMRDYVKLVDEDKSILANASEMIQHTLLPVKTVTGPKEIDLLKSAQTQQGREDKELQEAKAKITKMAKRGEVSRAQDAFNDYNELLQTVEQNQQRRRSAPIRGEGFPEEKK